MGSFRVSVRSLSANFGFSSCPRQTGLAKPRPFSAEAYSGFLRAAEQKRPSMDSESNEVSDVLGFYDAARK